MNDHEKNDKEITPTASAWLIPLEPEVEIEESEKTLDVVEMEEHVEKHLGNVNSNSEATEEDVTPPDDEAVEEGKPEGETRAGTKNAIKSSKSSKLKEDILVNTEDDGLELKLEEEGKEEIRTKSGEKSTKKSGKHSKLKEKDKIDLSLTKNKQSKQNKKTTAGETKSTKVKIAKRAKSDDESVTEYDNDYEVEEQSTDSEEENNVQAVQELESVLVGKMCEVCGNFFQTFELVNAEPNKPLLSTCETCSYYITPPVLAAYGSSNPSEFSCDKRHKMFVSKDGLLRHKTTHSILKPFSCEFCGKCYKINEKLSEHIKLVHVEDENGIKEKCITCGSVDNIITINVGENEAECIKLCEACNLSRQERMSEANRNGSKLFPCGLCSKSFARRDHATRHRLSHLNIKPFECSICKKSYSRNDRLLRHMKIHPGAKPFSCKVCSKAFSDYEKLKAHILTHPKVNKRKNSVKCEVCGRELRDKDRLNKHMASHGNKKPFTCEICGKSFKLRGALLTHQRIHSDLSEFKCDTCGMEFKIRDYLIRHMLIHSDVKTYSCEVCSKIFKRKDKLQTHRLVHIDVRPYSCDLCSSAFKRKDKYTRHVREVHKINSDDDKVITCSLCGLTFICEDDLTEHKMVHYR